MQLECLDPFNPDQAFPELEKALVTPNGLLAFGGCLSLPRLVNAYQQGIFPWYNPGEPILWWSPNPRLVLFPEKLKVSRSLQKTLRQQVFKLSYDTAFAEVMHACAAPRRDAGGTWITPEMLEAYENLHRNGVCHSFEAWYEGELVGGLYGVSIGRVFFGESMFHTRTDASKVVFVTLVRQLALWGYQMIDCQVRTQHLLNFGAEEIVRPNFRNLLQLWCQKAPSSEAWVK